jgi:hypothetical protein
MMAESASNHGFVDEVACLDAICQWLRRGGGLFSMWLNELLWQWGSAWMFAKGLRLGLMSIEMAPTEIYAARKSRDHQEGVTNRA